MHRGYKQSPEHIAARFRSRQGWKHSEKTKKQLAENAFIRVRTDEDKKRQSEIVKEWHRMNPRKGPDHPQFKGKHISKGYVLLYRPEHPHRNSQGYVHEHRLEMEKYLGRYLDPSEIVHHKDADKMNNDIGNLLLTTQKGHPRGEREMYKRGYDMGFAKAFVLFSTMISTQEKLI